MITITIKTGNAAFADNWHGEVARILRKLAKDIESNGIWSGLLYDINGNKVGMAITEKD